MQVSQTDLPSSYQLTTKATPVLPSKTSLEESERLRKELEDEEDKKAQKPGKKSKKIDTSATTSQKSASVADPKPHPKPSKKKKVLNFKDDGPLIVAEDKLDDVILPSPTTPHRSLSLFPAISVAPRAIAEELLPEISLQPGEIKVPSRGPTPLPEKWCDLCPPNLLAW